MNKQDFLINHQLKAWSPFTKNNPKMLKVSVDWKKKPVTVQESKTFYLDTENTFSTFLL